MDTLSSKLSTFRKTFGRKQIRHGNEIWEYFAVGRGECIVFLHGGMATGEMYFEYLQELQGSYRVIAPCLPLDADTVQRALAGVTAILDAEKIEKCHLFGHSQGGGLASQWADRLPQCVRTLMISSTVLPSSAHADAVRKQTRIASLIPNFLLHAAFRFALRRAFGKSGSVLSSEQQRFLLDDLTPMPDGAELRRYAGTQARLQLDYHSQKIIGDPPPVPTLLFETGRDGFVSQAETAALRARYPQARICRFEDGGHLDVMTKADRFIPVIEDFLRSAA